jgi:catechol 2,3-dioxygenase-like lactoylglutathione lyase family enzyme
MTEVIEGLEEVTVHIRDVERSRSFYRDVLGLREVSFLPLASRVAFALPSTSVLLTMHVQAAGEGGREPGTVSGVVFTHHVTRWQHARRSRDGAERSSTRHTLSPRPSEP